MRAVIIEDEKLSAEQLTCLLQKADNSIEIINYFDTVKESIQAFRLGLQCDLILMDIHLGDGNCFKIFDEIKIDIPIIFTTAYDRYALDAFKQFSIDYLLKPISFDDVCFALEKYKRYHQKSFTNNYLQLSDFYKSRFIVKTGRLIDTISVGDIHHFESRDSVTFLVHTSQKKYIIDYSLDELNKLLPTQEFFRINRKVILHVQAIHKVNTHSNSRLVVTSNNPDLDLQIVSRERVSEFKKWLDR